LVVHCSQVLGTLEERTGGTGARFGLCRDVAGGERSDGSREMKCSGLEGWW